MRQVKSESPNEAVFNDKFKRRRMMSKRNSFERNNRESANREQPVDWIKIEKEREDSIKVENKKNEKIKNEKESKKEAERQKEIEARKRKEEEDMKIKRINDELSRKRKLPARPGLLNNNVRSYKSSYSTCVLTPGKDKHQALRLKVETIKVGHLREYSMNQIQQAKVKMAKLLKPKPL